ncbi:phosphoglucosamine mutase [Psychromonas ingrahamii 37]|uniref:Phosphoglucosamine mutase n=1 Tax=Psychromonas ingrahamii (strain DSM 17664 / CCUG 51855 / 37) TaxID=357804 RepID=GLMM_PSYIN|nr:phosphoglucosamine mutase [Psychromonas ingrahamii]A1ST41.1 RecName: Full=Phosphoglucosamine mutase [Psychromonas ingrahamii 37]ABM02656.1 phosphoglucosamine mutase [Psychromonas ingrahamii 37]
MKKKYFGTDGIRGKVGASLITPEFTLKLGWAAGRVLAKSGSKKVLIGKDPRISGYMLEAALEAGLAAAGLRPVLMGPMPTPAVAYLTQTFRATAGIVISASHNPYYDNGIKFFSDQGTKLSEEIELEIEAEIDKELKCVDSSELGKAYRIEDAAGRYIEFCKSTFPSKYNLNGLKVVVDCANGATYHIAPLVISELGADVIAMGVEPDGLNINLNCGATSMQAISERVVKENADFGIAFDGDGDRVMMVDHTGYVLDGDELLYIIARDKLRSGTLKGGAVGTKMSNLGLEQSLKTLGIPFERSDVGDRHVMELMIKNNWCIGAENSGHIICSDHLSTGDGIVSGLQVISAMQSSRMKLYELRQGIKKYPQILLNLGFDNKIDPLQDNDVLAEAKRIETLLGDKGRVLLRKSGTEPVFRIMVEADESEKVVRGYAKSIADKVKV